MWECTNADLWGKEKERGMGKGRNHGNRVKGGLGGRENQRGRIR
jgi:hypothetical protein